MKKKIKILHLEDDPRDAELIFETLKSEGFDFELEWVQSQESFCAALERSHRDLILADFKMPGFDGTAALAIVQERKCEIPFIFVSGTIGEEAAIETVKRGATDYVLKNRLQRLAPSLHRALREAEVRKERLCAEEKIREQAQLLDLAQDAIIVRDLNGRIRFWNKGAERLYGWTAAEATTQDTPALLFGDASAYNLAAAKVVEKGYWTGELNKLGKSGKHAVVNCRWTLLRGLDGAPKSILSIDTDVTETKMLEAQFLRVQRMDSIGRLASGIAHDLNNILAPILFSVPMLRWGLEGEEFEKTLSTIEASAKRGAEVVKQLLTYGRGVEGERVVFHPKQLVQEMGKIINETFAKNIEFAAVIPQDLWPITGDTTQLHQVLMNLCVNARDAMPSGGKLTIEAQNVESDEHYAAMNPNAPAQAHVAIRVTDTGKGVPPEFMDQIFDPFFTTKELGKGTGLGLSTALGLVKSHGGFLTVRSSEGSGSTFEMILPASPKTALPDDAPSNPPIRRGRGELILVVDDEAIICEVTRKTLEKHGYEVLTARDGIEGIALFALHRGKIDLVLTDLVMPHMDGASLIKALHRMDPKVNIVVSTGVSQGPDEEAKMRQVEALGINTFLNKPYTGEKMLLTLEAALDSSP
ncbi:MAG: sensor hybrid histidine kinase [Verrucomicrobiales bacterium]|nr:sensor hybrid histidine kinase [Verrucomicrobiales bacterium]